MVVVFACVRTSTSCHAKSVFADGKVLGSSLSKLVAFCVQSHWMSVYK